MTKKELDSFLKRHSITKNELAVYWGLNPSTMYRKFREPISDITVRQVEEAVRELKSNRIPKPNSDIREAIQQSNQPLWVIARRLGLEDTNFCNLLWRPLDQEIRKKILDIITDSKGGEIYDAIG